MRKIFFILLLFSFGNGYTQMNQLFFNRLTVEAGLPEGEIICHLQDAMGYIWMGTQNGLVRYDGYHLKVYAMPDNAGRPLGFSSIQNLYEDAEGTLWADVDQEGVYYYNRQMDIFIKIKNVNYKTDKIREDVIFKILQGNNKNTYWFVSASTDGIVHADLYDKEHNTMEVFSARSDAAHFVSLRATFAVIKDSKGSIWAAGDSLLSLYSPIKNAFVPYFVLPGNAGKLKFNDIFTDPSDDNILWLTTYDFSMPGPQPGPGKLIKFNIKTRASKDYFHVAKDKNSIADSCSQITTDTKKRMLFCNGHIVSIYNRQSDNFTNYSFTLPLTKKGTASTVSSIAADKKGDIWASGDFAGLIHLNTATGISFFYPSGALAGGLPETIIEEVFFDRTGTLWVTVPYEGIASLNPLKSYFYPLAIQAPVSSNTEKNYYRNVKNIYKNDDSSFFITTNNNLYIWDYYYNSFKKIDINFSPAVINDMLKDKDGLIWIATKAGLYCYDQGTKTMKIYTSDSKDSSSLSGNNIHKLAEGNNGTIWIGTFRNGICNFNRQSGKFTRYPFAENADFSSLKNVLDDSFIQSLYFDDEGILWIGTNQGGLNRFDPKTNTFTRIESRKDGLRCVTTICKDRRGHIWAGTYMTGLFLVDSKTASFRRYTDKDGLCYSGINGISEDNEGNIWIATQRGLSKLNPVTDSITNFTTTNALQNNEISDISHTSTGRLNAIVKNGILSFNPGQLENNNIPPSVQIESVNYHATTNTLNNNDTSVFTHGHDNIHLEHNENRVTFQYIGLHFANAALNQYAYKLDGYDKGWIKAGTQRTATYTNLSPDTYVFRVKASNSDGIWGPTGASIVVIIYPPWWQTWWAYTLYVLLATAAIGGFVYYRSKKLRKDNRILEHKIRLRTAEVLEQKEEIVAQRDNLEKTLGELQATQSQLIQSEKMASLGQLTAGIAHEIQNPLNFVNNFSEVSNELIDEAREELLNNNTDDAIAILDDVKQNLEKINHHGKRADAIVKGMLQHSRTSTGKKESTDINTLADEYLRLSYHGLRAKDKSFNATVNTDFDETIDKINIIPQDIGRVLINLFNNAFYAVTEKKKESPHPLKEGMEYQPTITLTTKRVSSPSGPHVPVRTGDGGVVLISVTDNGNGIPQNIIDKIFQPFFTTKPTGQGTGLGLSLSYDIIKAHGGEIKVETKENEGTTFIIQLPIT